MSTPHVPSLRPIEIGVAVAVSAIISISGCGGGGSGGASTGAPATSSAPPAPPAPLGQAPSNTTPVAQAGSAQSAKTGFAVQLDGSASSDADGDALTYAWTLYSAPAGSTATLSNASSAKPSFTPDVGGTYVASLVVSDGKASSTAAQVQVKVDSVAFSSMPTPFPPNMPSWGFQATQTASLGETINLKAGTTGTLKEFTIAMSSWACENGGWNGTCTTTPGATFQWPVTLRLIDGAGHQFATATKTFTMPFRPSSDPSCAVTTKWKAADGTCYNGYAFKISFDATDLPNVSLPATFSYEIAYDTQSYGTAPTGNANGPYNSLNGGMYDVTLLPSAGSDADITKLRQNGNDVAAGGYGVMVEIVTKP